MSQALQAIRDGQALGRIVRSTEPADALTALVQRCFATGPMCAAPVEGSDGILVGGVIVVRGEHEFNVVRAFLQAHCQAPAASLPQAQRSEA